MPLDDPNAHVCEANPPLAECPTRVLGIVMPSGRSLGDRRRQLGRVPLDGVVGRVPMEQHFDDDGRVAELLGSAFPAIGTRCQLVGVEGVPDGRNVRAEGADSQVRVWLGSVRFVDTCQPDGIGKLQGTSSETKGVEVLVTSGPAQPPIRTAMMEKAPKARHDTERYPARIQNVPDP